MVENRWTIGLFFLLLAAAAGLGAYVYLRPDGTEDLGTAVGTVDATADAGTKSEPRRADAPQATSRPKDAEAQPVAETPIAESSDAAAPRPRTVVRGRVVTETGEPIADAELQISTATSKVSREGGRATVVRNVLGRIDERRLAKTAADGRFELAVDVESSGDLRARPAAFCDAKKTFSVPDENPVDLGDIVCAIGATVEGKVTTSAGLPVKDARVRVRKTQNAGPSGLLVFGGNEDLYGGISERTGKTDDNGFFKIAGVEPGGATVTADSPDYPQGSVKDLRTKKGETLRDVVVVMPLGRTIEGAVRADDGAPVEGVEIAANVMDGFDGEVSLEELATNARKKTTTDAEGRFRLKGLREAAVSLSARKQGYQTVRSVNVDAEQKSIDITLLSSGIVFGYVIDSIGQKPIEKFTIETIVGGQPQLSRRVTPQSVLSGAAAAKALGLPEAPNLYAVLDASSSDLRIFGRADGYSAAVTPSIRLQPRGRVQQDVILPREARVSGVCRDKKGAPVEGVTVALTVASQAGSREIGGGSVRARSRAPSDDFSGDEEPTATTKMDGTFEIRGIRPETYLLTGEHPDYVGSAATEIVLAAGQIVDNAVVIVEEGGILAGTALDAEGGALEGGVVTLRPTDRDEKNAVMLIDGSGADMDVGGSKSAVAAKDGRFEIRGVSPGRWTASVRALRRADQRANFAIAIPGMSDGRPSKGVPVDIEAGKTTRIELRVPAQAVLSGTVIEAQSPVVGVKVSLLRVGTPNFLGGGPSAETDENGAFEIKGIDPGDYELNVQPKAAPIPYSEPISFTERQRVVRDIKLPTGVISGKVEKKSGGEPMEGVVVTAVAVVDRPAGEKQTESNVTVMSIMSSNDGDDESPIIFSTGTTPVRIATDKSGRYELRNLKPGNYKVSISGKGVRPDAKEKIAVEDGRETKNVDFTVEIGAVLLVTVEGKKDGGPFLHGMLIPKDSPDAEPTTSGKPWGKPLKFEGLRAGAYTLQLDRGPDSKTFDVSVAEGEKKSVTFRLD